MSGSLPFSSLSQRHFVWRPFPSGLTFLFSISHIFPFHVHSMFCWSVTCNIFIRLKRWHNNGSLLSPTAPVWSGCYSAWRLCSPSPPRTFPSLLLCWSFSFCVLSSPSYFIFHAFQFYLFLTFAPLPGLWPPTSNFLSSSLSYLLAFFLLCLPGASALMLPCGSPALCEVAHASLLLLELSLENIQGNSYIWNSPDLGSGRADISDSYVS